jgi:hypothetical protein
LGGHNASTGEIGISGGGGVREPAATRAIRRQLLDLGLAGMLKYSR